MWHFVCSNCLALDRTYGTADPLVPSSMSSPATDPRQRGPSSHRKVKHCCCLFQNKINQIIWRLVKLQIPIQALGSVFSCKILSKSHLIINFLNKLIFRVVMTANMKQSYDVSIDCRIVGTSIESQNTLDLKNPYFRYTGVQPQPPPGENSQSPSEVYWTQVDMAGARQVSQENYSFKLINFASVLLLRNDSSFF